MKNWWRHMTSDWWRIPASVGLLVLMAAVLFEFGEVAGYDLAAVLGLAGVTGGFWVWWEWFRHG